MKKTFLTLVTVISLLTGCSIYHPQSVDIPLLDHEGETRIDGALGISMLPLVEGPTLNLTASHAFNDWFSGQAHMNFSPGCNYLQMSPGAYTAMGDHFVIEGFTGVGAGWAKQNEISGTNTETNENVVIKYSGNHVIPYVQLNLGWRHVWIFEFAMGLKVGAFIPNFTYIEQSETSIDPHYYCRVNSLVEPSFQIRIGGEHMMLTSRLGFCSLRELSQNPSSRMDYDPFTYSRVTFSLGFTYSFTR